MRGRALVILWSGVISFYPIKALILSRINFLILIDFLNSGFDSFFSNTTRFALAANSSEKIIEPIQSRCAMLRYRSSSRHVFTNFPITNLQIFSTKYDMIFVLIFSNAQNREKKFLFDQFFTNSIQAPYFNYLAMNPENVSDKKEHKIHPLL